MLQPIPFAEAQQVIQKMGLDQHLRWCRERAPFSRNVMVLTDPLVNEKVDPLARSVEELNSSGVRMTYRDGPKYWSRRQEPKPHVLMHFLRQVLAADPGHGLLIQSVEDDGLPVPWCLPTEVESLARQPNVSRLFSNMGINIGDSRPLRCHTQEDFDDIELIASWSLSAGWRNTFLLADHLKTLVCHEQDLHFCSTSVTTIESVVKLAESEGLCVAPFDIEQCA